MTAIIGGKGTSSKTFLWITIDDREYEFTFNTHEEACFAKEKWLREFNATPKPRTAYPEYLVGMWLD